MSKEREVVSTAPVTKTPARSVRHELRTPLNQIIGYSELLQEEAEDLGQDAFVPDLEKIAAAGRRLLELINNLTLPDNAPLKTGNIHLPPATDPAAARPAVVSSGVVGLEPCAAAGPKARLARVAGRLLVVDDSAENRDMLGRRLTREGYTVALAAGGWEGMALLEQEAFDLVLLDVMMPDVSGLEMLVTLREKHNMAELPIIMVTARNASEDIVEALHLGANDHVTKPIDFPVVLARILTQLALKRAQDQVSRLNSRLEDAQDRIANLIDSSSEALLDVNAWSTSFAREVGRAIGAQEVAVWIRDDVQSTSLAGQEMIHITGGMTDPPSPDQVQRLETERAQLTRPSDVLVPVRGLTGSLFGVLAIIPPRAAQSDEARQILSSFCGQLGGVLELKQTRRSLAEAVAQRRATRKDLLDRGVDLLHVCPFCNRCYDQTRERCEDDGAPLLSPRPFPYRVADRYRLVKILGEGGMGVVYEAHDQHLGRDVALKVIRSKYFDDDTIQTRFKNEARAVARIDHPNVISVFDSGELEDGSLYIVMELLRGRGLEEIFDTFGPGTPQQVAALVRQGSAALAAAHQAGLIHRDVKPENIHLVPTSGGLSFKVLDFGIAKEIATESNLTRTGDLVGTPMYMAPEQLSGERVDTRSDIYSFAAVAYQALVGRRVTLATNFARVFVEVLNEIPPAISSILPSVPPAVDAAFARALAKSPDERPGSIGDWAASLAQPLEQVESVFAGWPVDLDQLMGEGEESPLNKKRLTAELVTKVSRPESETR